MKRYYLPLITSTAQSVLYINLVKLSRGLLKETASNRELGLFRENALC